ncbi:MAG: AraC family transcriptional regulator ligand-binding domain-containing protein [Halieaceae bacterium]|nr:AraC family transcriptional regulator ligand-binding domain-containing protein [Halieaceae bacterium]
MATLFSERLLARWEGELGPYADRLGLSRAIFRRHDTEFPTEMYYRLLESASGEIPDIGLRIGCSMQASDMGALGHAVAATATLDAALTLLSTYLNVFSHNNTVRLDVGKDHANLTYRLSNTYHNVQRQDVELATAFLARLVRDLCGNRSINPTRVELAHTRPDYAAALEQHFGCELRYECGHNRLHYPRRLLELPVLSTDPSLLEALQFYLAERTRARNQEDPLADRVYHLISASLRDGAADIDHVAGLLGMGRRTLQRRLAGENLVFGEMLASVRREVAEQYLRRNEYSLTEISLMLGYSDLSAFSRAYRRWTGISPKEIRKPAQS